MLRINGEIINFINEIDFNNKDEFLEKLRAIRKTPNLQSNCDYDEFYQMIGIAIQQAFYTNPNQLARYKEYCKQRAETGVKQCKINNLE